MGVTAVLHGGPHDGRREQVPPGCVLVMHHYDDDAPGLWQDFYKPADFSFGANPMRYEFDRTELWNPPPAPPYTRRERFRMWRSEQLWRLRRR